MIIHGRVTCDICECDMGQFIASVVSRDLLPDMRVPPSFCVCPDCHWGAVFGAQGTDWSVDPTVGTV
ncbi:hypothetical protein D3C78_711810 [compost metagenome]